MLYRKKVMYGAFLISAVLFLNGIFSLSETETLRKTLGVVQLLCGAIILACSFKYKNSNHFGIMLLLIYPVVFTFVLAKQLLFNGSNFKMPLAGMLGPGLIAIFCLWQSYRLWRTGQSPSRFESHLKADRPKPGKDTEMPKSTANLNLDVSTGIPLLLCLGSAITFVIGIIRKDNQFIKLGIIGFSAGGWMVFKAFRNRKKQNKISDSNDSEEAKAPTIMEPIADDIDEPNIKDKIWEIVGPTNITLADEKEITELGEEAIPYIVDILKNPLHDLGSANQALLTAALIDFAANGNEVALQTLNEIVQDKVSLVGPDGKSAYNMASNFISTYNDDSNSNHNELDETDDQPHSHSQEVYEHNSTDQMPPIDQIPEAVKCILTYLPDIEMAKQVIDGIKESNRNKLGLNIQGGNTKQGRYALNIEGHIPKSYALTILEIILKSNGSIEVVAGK